MSDCPLLWRVMIDSYCDATHSVAREMGTIAIGTAAEIRAVRDWLVPEEAEPWGKAQAERQRLRDLLTAEADRAECGDPTRSENDATNP